MHFVRGHLARSLDTQSFILDKAYLIANVKAAICLLQCCITNSQYVILFYRQGSLFSISDLRRTKMVEHWRLPYWPILRIIQGDLRRTVAEEHWKHRYEVIFSNFQGDLRQGQMDVYGRHRYQIIFQGHLGQGCYFSICGLRRTVTEEHQRRLYWPIFGGIWSVLHRSITEEHQRLASEKAHYSNTSFSRSIQMRFWSIFK